MPELALAEDSRLMTQEWGDEEHLEDALLTALETAGVDLDDLDQPLVEFVDPDALQGLRWTNPHLTVRTRVRNHPVRITPGRIEVFSSRRDGPGDRPGGSERER